MPSAERGWMATVTPEVSIWTQLGLLCEVEGPLVSENPVETRAACQAERRSAALTIYKVRRHTHSRSNVIDTLKKLIKFCFD